MNLRWLKVPLLLSLLSAAVVIGGEYKFGLATKIRQEGWIKLGTVAYERLRKEGPVQTVRAIFAKIEDPVVQPQLRYSIFDAAAGAALTESAAERAALPEFKVIAGVDPAKLAPSRDDAQTYDGWGRSHGNSLSSKFSSHAQIDRSNVAKLEVAWTHHSGDDLGDPTKIGTTVQTNPVIAGGLLFVGGENALRAIDAATGQERWRLKLPGPVARRGLVWEPNADFAKSRLFVPTSRGVYAVGAADGQIRSDFGDQGRVGGELSLIAPLVLGDKLVIAIAKPAVEAYALNTGKLLWTTGLLEKSATRGSALYGGVPWAGMSGDAARGTVYVSTGNPRPPIVGTTRPGDNAHSSSVVAIDTATGAIRWAFQDVAHDLWDLDVPSPPVLTTITRGGRRVDVVAAPTKTGNTLLLDRDSGLPIFDYRLRRAPTSSIPGERTAPYQPAVELPEPFTKQLFEASDFTDRSEAARQAVLRKTRGAKMGFFEPPFLGGSVVVYGPHGGAEWPGAAADPRNGVLFVPSNQLPLLLRAHYLDSASTAAAAALVPGDALYQAACASCHKPTGEGAFENEYKGDANYPPLNGITALRDRATLTSKAEFNRQHQAVKLQRDINAAELETLYGYFSALDRRADQARSFITTGYWQLLLDDDGHPGSKPPWGQLTAIDLNTGKRVWQVPFGAYENLQRQGQNIQGQRNTGGVIATAGGLVFGTGTLDNGVRAYDANTGRELWSYKLPASGSTPPATYVLNGVQYLVVVAGGGQHVGHSGRSDQIIAFRLPAGLR